MRENKKGPLTKTLIAVTDCHISSFSLELHNPWLGRSWEPCSKEKQGNCLQQEAASQGAAKGALPQGDWGSPRYPGATASSTSTLCVLGLPHVDARLVNTDQRRQHESPLRQHRLNVTSSPVVSSTPQCPQSPAAMPAQTCTTAGPCRAILTLCYTTDLGHYRLEKSGEKSFTDAE